MFFVNIRNRKYKSGNFPRIKDIFIFLYISHIYLIVFFKQNMSGYSRPSLF